MSTKEIAKPVEDPKPAAEEEPDTKKQKMSTPQSPDEGTKQINSSSDINVPVLVWCFPASGGRTLD